MSDMTKRPSAMRELHFDVQGRAESDAIPVVVSSDEIVQVKDGPEILAHTADAVDLQRAPLPIIATHRGGQINVGLVDSLRIDGGQMRGVARFGERQEAAEYRRDVVNGIIRSVSVGYDRLKAKVRADGVMVTTRWMPTHVAMVAEPADVRAGFYRAQPAGFDLEVEPAASVPHPPAAPAAAQPQKESTVDESKQAATGTNVETRQAPRVEVVEDHGQRRTAMEVENLRREAIQNLCKANNIDPRTESDWVRTGTQLDIVAREILGIQVERQKENKKYAGTLGLSNKDQQRYSFFKAVRALHYGNRNPELIREAAFEIELSREVSKRVGKGDTVNMMVPADILQRPIGEPTAARAMAATPGGKGGYMVDVQNMGFIDILRNRSVAMNMGATTLQLDGNASFVRQTGSATVSWQAGEHTSITATDQALGQLSMTPKTAIAITDVSEQLLRQSSPSAEAFVMRDLANTLAIAGVDHAVINGTGGAQPLGIKNTTGVTTGQDAGTASYAKLLAFASTAAGANAVLMNPGFVTNAAGASILMQKARFSNTDTPLWEGNMFDGTCVGFRGMSSEQLASGNLIFGSWGEVIIGEWGVLELATDTGGTRFNAATVGIRAMWMVDVLVRYPQAFVVSTNLSA